MAQAHNFLRNAFTKRRANLQGEVGVIGGDSIGSVIHATASFHNIAALVVLQ